MRSLLDRFGISGSETTAVCSCTISVADDQLHVNATDCDGTLATAADCRETVIRRLAARDVEEIVIETAGLEHRYPDQGVALLRAAGRFVDLVAARDERLADLAARDPLQAAQEAATRAGPVADIAAESGLCVVTEGLEDYSSVLEPAVGLTISQYLVDPLPATQLTLRAVESLETGSTVRIFDRPDSVPLYTVDVVDLALCDSDREVLLAAYDVIAEGEIDGDRLATRAIDAVTDGASDPRLTKILEKHTQGYGILEDLFADSSVSDVYVTAPVADNPVRVVVDGESMATNLSLTEEGARTLASRVRRTSGRSFSRANPTVDATASLENGTGVRIAGVTDPVATGVAFAFREQADDTFTLPALVENGTMTAEAAAFLSVAIERNAAALVAGTRGAGKTTLLGTLLYEVTPDTRTVIIEDTPELPVGPLQSVDRDVQALRTGTGDGPEITAAEALRTALRLGDGALVVGEIRGEEAAVLYEAMRVGANANAVLGTIHGDGASDVFERVVSDLEVPPSSFGATDLVVTVQAYRTPNGRKRRLSAIEEVIHSDDDIWFEPLYVLDGDQPVSTGRIERGESRFINRITGPANTYADVRETIETRENLLSTLAAGGRVSPAEIAAVYADRGR